MKSNNGEDENAQKKTGLVVTHGCTPTRPVPSCSATQQELKYCKTEDAGSGKGLPLQLPALILFSTLIEHGRIFAPPSKMDQ